MSRFPFPTINLDEELFIRRNPFQATLVIFNCLIGNDLAGRQQILGRLRKEQLRTDYDEFLFVTIVRMIENQGQVDIEQLRGAIRSYGAEDPDFVEGNLAELDFLLTFSPTPKQVTQALDILTSLPPPTKFRRHSQGSG